MPNVKLSRKFTIPHTNPTTNKANPQKNNIFATGFVDICLIWDYTYKQRFYALLAVHTKDVVMSVF